MQGEIANQQLTYKAPGWAENQSCFAEVRDFLQIQDAFYFEKQQRRY